MAFPLSVLDLSPVDAGVSQAQALRNTIDAARLADRLGYTRYWLAEHHNLPSVVSSTPEVMIGQVARETFQIRVGSGGIMLPNHRPLKVAETFRVLEALFPDRIDLGIGRAPGTDQVTALALRRSREALGAVDFPEQLAELLAFTTGEFPETHPFRSVVAVPNEVALPPIWLLGSSDFSADLAAALGLGFAFAHHINAADAVPAMRAYRQQFTPSRWLAQPHAIITAAVVCAETDAQVEELAATADLSWVRLRSGRPGPLPSVAEALAYPYSEAERSLLRASRAQRLVGDPATVRAHLQALVERTQADEAMIMPRFHGHAARLRSLELLADVFELPRPLPAPVGAA